MSVTHVLYVGDLAFKGANEFRRGAGGSLGDDGGAPVGRVVDPGPSQSIEPSQAVDVPGLVGLPGVLATSPTGSLGVMVLPELDRLVKAQPDLLQEEAVGDPGVMSHPAGPGLYVLPPCMVFHQWK